MYVFIDHGSALIFIVNNYLFEAGTMNMLSLHSAERAAVNTLNYLQRYNRSDDFMTPPFSDDESHVFYPVLDSLYSIQRNPSIHHLTNFSKTEFMIIYEMIEIKLTAKFARGKGRKFKFSPTDMLLMLLTLSSVASVEIFRRTVQIENSYV